MATLGNSVNSNEITITGSLTSAQIKLLHASPIQVVAAPGVGSVVRIVRCLFKMNYGGTNAFTDAASGINLQYSTTLAAVAQCLTNTDMTATTTRLNGTNPAAIGAANSSYDNLPINIYRVSVTEIGGNAANDNTITYSITYQYITI